jgi:PAS domain S-box-containing protein
MKERNKKKQDLEDTPIPTYKQSRKTDRNLAGAAHSEKMFQTIFDHAALGVAQIVSKTGRFVRVNQRYCDIVGYSREEMETLTSQDITHTDDLQPDLDNMQHLLVGKIREFSMEKRYIRKDGSIVRVSLSAFALWDPGEEPDTHVAVVEDITKRRRMEEESTRPRAPSGSMQRCEKRCKRESLTNSSWNWQIRIPGGDGLGTEKEA